MRMLQSWLTAHFHALQRALRRLLSQPLTTMLSVLVIGIAMLLPLGLYLLFHNVSAAASLINTQPKINVYLTVGATLDEAQALLAPLKKINNVAEVMFVSKDSALAELKRVSSLSDLIQGLESNPLPHAFVIRPQSSEPAVLEAMRQEIAALPRVEAVILAFEWARKLQRFARFAEHVVWLLVLILSVAVMFVTGNTIRLQMLTQRDEIEVSRLIGGTRFFIRRPFLYFGFLQGALAGLIAIAAAIALVSWVSGEVQALGASYGGTFSLTTVSPSLALAVIGLGAALGWLGAFLSVSVYLMRPSGH
ncbi:MAG: ABC transporter permease [Betaproteobacteria bacterium]|nr:ABC transporter permease [Betaproteobacteria bacterium]